MKSSPSLFTIFGVNFSIVVFAFLGNGAFAKTPAELIAEMKAECGQDAVCASAHVINAISVLGVAVPPPVCKPGGILSDNVCFFKVQSEYHSCEHTCSLFAAVYDPSGINVSKSTCEKVTGTQNLPTNGYTPYTCSILDTGGLGVSFGGGGVDGKDKVGYNTTKLKLGYCSCR